MELRSGILLGAGRVQSENKQREVIFLSSFTSSPSTSIWTLGKCAGGSSGLGEGLDFGKG